MHDQATPPDFRGGKWIQTRCEGHTAWVFFPEQRATHLAPVLFLSNPERIVPHDDDRVIQSMAAHGITCVIPQEGPMWWLGEIVPQFDERWSSQSYLVDHLIPHLVQTEGIASPPWGLLGTGMGGQGALALAYRYPRQFPHVAAIAPELDFHLLVPHDDEVLTETFGSREWARQHTPILGIHPLNWPPSQYFCCDPTDPWFDSVDRLRMKLNSIGIPCTHDLETEGGGHSERYFAKMAPRAVEFLVAGMRNARLRVVH